MNVWWGLASLFGMSVCVLAQDRSWTNAEQNQYLEFELSQEFRPKAPLAAELKWNGQSIDLRSASERQKYFRERHLARLDVGQWIEILPQSPQSPQSWIYPNGFSLAHEIRFELAPDTLFELRTLERRDGQWIFETFLEGHQVGQLKRRTNSGLEKISGELVLRSGEKARYDITRIRSTVCAQCHAQSAGQEGPCGFGPKNLKMNEWRKNFKEQFGRDPMKESN